MTDPQSTSLQPDEQAQPTDSEMLDWSIRVHPEVRQGRGTQWYCMYGQDGIAWGDTPRAAIRAAMKDHP